jgi:putative flippase GtrA
MPGVASNEDLSAGQRQRTSLYERLRRSDFVRRALNTSIVEHVLKPARGDASFNKFVRYSLVSAVAIAISQTTILICTWLFGLSGIAANTIGAVVATPASYELNRKWAWRKGGKSHLWREVVPFWALTLIGWLASTGTVQIADNLCQSHGVTGLARSIAIMFASLFAYGVVWIGKFFLFNRIIFATNSAGVAAASDGVHAPGLDVAGEPVAGARDDGAPEDGSKVDGARLNGTRVDRAEVNGAEEDRPAADGDDPAILSVPTTAVFEGNARGGQ